MAQLVEHRTLDLRVLNFSPKLGVEIALKKKKKILIGGGGVHRDG